MGQKRHKQPRAASRRIPLSDAIARARRIREARLAAGLTQQQVGTRIGTTKAAISQWENTETPPDMIGAEHILRLANVTGFDCCYIVTGRLPKRATSEKRAELREIIERIADENLPAARAMLEGLAQKA